MGQQQILLLVLASIIVFASIVAGISIYKQYQTRLTKLQCFDELNYLKARVSDYFKTARTFGGSSYGAYEWNPESIAEYIGVGWDGSNTLETTLSEYTISIDEHNVTFLAKIKDDSIDKNIRFTYNVYNGDTSIVFEDQ